MPNSTFQASAPDFIAGRLGMIADSSAQIGRLNREVGSAFPVRVAKFPIAAPDGRIPSGGAAVMIFAKDPAKQRAAWEFMKFATGPVGATIIVKSTGYVPATDLPAKDPTMLGDFYRDSPNHRVALEQLPLVTAWYAFPGENGVKITDVIRDHLQTVVTKEAKPDDVLRQDDDGHAGAAAALSAKALPAPLRGRRERAQRRGSRTVCNPCGPACMIASVRSMCSSRQLSSFCA